MTLEELVLRNDTRNHYTESEIKRQLKQGVFVYATYQEFFENWIGCWGDEEDAPAAWNALDTAEVDGTTYHYDVVL